MDTFKEFIFQYAHLAHWFAFGALILAGLNIPLSADLIILTVAILAATVVPENTLLLFLSVFFGCCLSAWTAYWLGRSLGPTLQRFRWFSKLLSKKRLVTIETFYTRHGLLTLIIGRFIPFGVRNCIFMTTGLTKVHFGKFILRDLLACFIWCSTCFYTFYTLSQYREILYSSLKTFNLILFLAFSVTVIGVVWYKRTKKAASKIER